MKDYFEDYFKDEEVKRVSIVAHNHEHAETIVNFLREVCTYLNVPPYHEYMKNRGYSKIHIHVYRTNEWRGFGYDRHKCKVLYGTVVVEMRYLMCRK